VATAQLLSCSLELKLELNLQLALAAGCHRPYRSGESRRDQLHSGLTSRKSTYDEISEPRIASRVNVWGGVCTQKVTTIDRRSQASETLIRNTETPRHLETVRLPIIRHPGRQWALPTQTSADPPPSHETGNFEFDLLLPKVRSGRVECIVSTKPEPYYDATATTRPYASRGVPLDSSESQTPQPDIRIRL